MEGEISGSGNTSRIGVMGVREVLLDAEISPCGRNDKGGRNDFEGNYGVFSTVPPEAAVSIGVRQDAAASMNENYEQ